MGKHDARDRTFGVGSVTDLISKLDYEIIEASNVAQSHPEHPRFQAYSLINGATTAWQALDWIAHDLGNASGWGKASAALGVSLEPDKKVFGKEKLQSYARSSSVDMRACEQIATAAKHMFVSEAVQKDKVVTNSLRTKIHGNADSAAIIWLTVEIDGTTYVGINLLDNAAAWLTLIYQKLVSAGALSPP